MWSYTFVYRSFFRARVIMDECVVTIINVRANEENKYLLPIKILVISRLTSRGLSMLR